MFCKTNINKKNQEDEKQIFCAKLHHKEQIKAFGEKTK